MRLNLPLYPHSDAEELMTAFERRRGRLNVFMATVIDACDLPWVGYFAGRMPSLQCLVVDARLPFDDSNGDEDEEPCLPWPQERLVLPGLAACRRRLPVCWMSGRLSSSLSRLSPSLTNTQF